jgi:septal ring factor EnvC (AmiA/AmiB activator)
MLRIAYRHRLNGSFLSFLFSAHSFNDAFRRWQYLRQYDRYRKRQAQLIVETQAELTQRAQQLDSEREEKERLLLSAEEQQKLLAKELGVMNELIANLKKNESEVASTLKDQQSDHQKLNNLIEDVIFKEMARKRKEARQPNALKAKENPTENAATPSPVLVDAAIFVKNKGQLPWPVQNGTITRHFGTQTHPTIKSVEITNNGIDISTNANSDVRAIFSGEVVGVQYVPGYKNTLILQHGPYYTVYSNLEEAIVDRGDIVAAGQTVGRMGDSGTELHFEVWREKQKLNPIHWIQKK